MTENSESGGGKGKLILWIVILALVLILAYVVLMPGGLLSGSGEVDKTGFRGDMHEIVIRPADLELLFGISYTIQHDSRLSNEEVIGRMTAAIGKEYIIETDRVDGWDLYLEKTNNSDIGPTSYRSKVEIFETNDGAKKAFGKDWLWVYTDPDMTPDEYIDKSCKFGNDCIFFMYDEVTPGSGITTVRYDIVFRYKNVLVQLFIKGTDLETNEDDALEAAQLMYDHLTEID